MSFLEARALLQLADEQIDTEVTGFREGTEMADEAVRTTTALEGIVEGVSGMISELGILGTAVDGVGLASLSDAEKANGYVQEAAEGAVNNVAMTGLRDQMAGHVMALCEFGTNADPLIEEALAAATALNEKILAIRDRFQHAGNELTDFERDACGIKGNIETAQMSF